ncbi:MAG: hypothetical protein GX761_09855 [Gammaproteobacteria bacterium]|nr:hypothetical protein [Gammaproteobacteria bacterium]
MPIGDPTQQVPESEMRLLRPIGLGLLALFIGFNGGYLLILMIEMAGGPVLTQWAVPICLSVSVLVFAWLMRRSRRKREAAVRRAAAGQPRPLGRVMVASVLMIFLGLGLVWAALRHSPPNLGALGTAAVILVISVRSLVSTVLELRSRKS